MAPSTTIPTALGLVEIVASRRGRLVRNEYRGGASDGRDMITAVGDGQFMNVRRAAEDGPYACPCCGYLTLCERVGYEICPVCFWEDDGQDDHDADDVRGGANGTLSLTVARRTFADIGASSQRRLALVRPPRDDEHPPWIGKGWRTRTAGVPDHDTIKWT